MIRNKLIKCGAVAMSLALGASPVAAMAATTATTSNNTATTNDLANADIIDESKTGSLSIYKYDITAAEAAGDYEEGMYEQNGEADSRVEEAMADYGVEGVQFSYLRVGRVETHSVNTGDGSDIELVYEIPTELADILSLGEDDAVDMTGENEANPCYNGSVYHYTSQQIIDAMNDFLEADNVAAKDTLEDYFYDYGTLDDTQDQSVLGTVVNMPKTDETGYTHVEGLQLGLYLVVETEVPENVTDTVNPWFVQLPFTNEDPEATENGGEYWLYDMTCYPKNQTGNPTLDKSVRNAYSNTVAEDKNGTVHSGSDYEVTGTANTSESLVVWNNDSNASNTEDTSDEAYVANRGGYTADGVTAGEGGAGYSTDFTYADTTTASEGDILDYILVSKLPHITSSSTFLSEYTFTDTLSKGISYNQDVKIAFYDNAADANANNRANAVMVWNLADDTYEQKYVDVTVQDPDSGQVTADGSTQLTVSMTEEGLKVINGVSEDEDLAVNGLSDYYMVVFYTATVHSDSSVVLGDEGNPNDVSLVWSRTSDGYYNVLEDRNYVYSYAVDLTKEFSDGNGDFSNVEFKLYNQTDAYYVIASQADDGVYFVTGKTTSEDNGTTFIPNSEDGSLIVNGLEGDTYQLTEVATDNGYSLLKDQIVIDITSTDRDVIASVAGVTGMDADAVAAIVEQYHGGIYDENGNLVTEQSDEITGSTGNAPADETANGNDIGKIDMFVGEIQPASATVDNVNTSMTDGNAAVILSVLNSKGFTLPQTGGSGIYLITIIGVVAIAGGCYLIVKNRKKMA